MTKTPNQQKREKVSTLTEVIAGKHIPVLLHDLLEQKTPHPNEKLIYHLLPKNPKPIIDSTGNVVYFVGKQNKSKTLFSSHLDIVGNKNNTTKLKLFTDDKAFIYGAEKNEKEGGWVTCILGADDKIGVYIMCCMIQAKIPGVYVFHVGEEKGGIGSTAITKEKPEWLTERKFKRCIAFDRKDYTSVITKQIGSVCCSDVFAKGLALALNQQLKLNYSQFAPDPTGLFTDSANYVHLIPECTNLSVGYFNQHTAIENFDIVWLEQLFIPAALKMKWENLPTVRTPTKEPPPFKHTYLSKKSAWKDVNMLTPWDKIPLWLPRIDGYPEDIISIHVFEKVIEKWIISRGLSTVKTILANCFKDMKNEEKARNEKHLKQETDYEVLAMQYNALYDHLIVKHKLDEEAIKTIEIDYYIEQEDPGGEQDENKEQRK